MLHLTKLAVGVRDIDHLRELQADRAVRSPPLRHRTRSFPRRHQEVVDGGSMYWVISGSMLVRQRIVDIVEDRRDDGTACTACCWIRSWCRSPADRPSRSRDGATCPDEAPRDLVLGKRARGEDALPPALRRELQVLCLL